MEVSCGDEAALCSRPGCWALLTPAASLLLAGGGWLSSLKCAWFEVEHAAATRLNGRQQICEHACGDVKGGDPHHTPPIISLEFKEIPFEVRV